MYTVLTWRSTYRGRSRSARCGRDGRSPVVAIAARASALARITSGSRGSGGRSSCHQGFRRTCGLSIRTRFTVCHFLDLSLSGPIDGSGCLRDRPSRRCESDLDELERIRGGRYVLARMPASASAARLAGAALMGSALAGAVSLFSHLVSPARCRLYPYDDRREPVSASPVGSCASPYGHRATRRGRTGPSAGSAGRAGPGPGHPPGRAGQRPRGSCRPAGREWRYASRVLRVASGRRRAR
jgi:hypothetical protein